jgi:AMP-polyphosphate phosphotransferase
MLEKIDLSLQIGEDDYNKKLPELQLKLLRLQQKIREHKVPVLIAYEGWDASGKGGSILRITQTLDPRGYRVHPIGPPTDEEKAHHYLWRFWTRMPCAGEFCVFDRSWYGRVLVERVEKFTDKDDWKRAYREILEFERTLVDSGMVVVKFWMHISKDEQLRRFKERESDPFKKWKIGPDDWRNREKWDAYLEAAEDMFNKVSASPAPWHIIPAESKRYARIRTLEIVIESIEDAIKAKKPPAG